MLEGASLFQGLLEQGILLLVEVEDDRSSVGVDLCALQLLLQFVGGTCFSPGQHSSTLSAST